MNFNFGNLVSAAVGAVSKVANAVVNALSPVAKGGGLFGGIAGAVIGAAIAVANVCEDGEIDEDEIEEILANVVKVYVGACMAMFGSGSLGWEKQDDDDSSESIFGEIKKAARDFTIGAGYSWDNNMFFGVTTHVVGMNDDNLPDSTSCKAGRVAGDVASIIGSGAEIAAGTGGEIGGVALDATGAGALAGVPINVGAAVLVLDGVVNAYRSMNSLVNDLMNFASSNGGGTNGDFKFPKSNSDMKKIFKVNDKTYHKEIKPEILKQIRKDPEYSKEFKKMGDNPDIGVDNSGNIVLKDVRTGKTLPTNWSFESFIP